MLHEEKKIVKIVEELTVYFFTKGADDIQSGILREDNSVVITFRSNYNPIYEGKFDRMEQYLNEPQNEGIEDIYWELAGAGEPGEASQLMLIGMMTDNVELDIKDGYVNIKLYKELDE